MTENERLTNSDKEIPTLDDNAEYWLQVYFKLKDYEAIGTVEEVRMLKEKNEPKKPIERERNYLKVFDCPVCNAELYSGQRYCDECGQVILDDYE